MCVPRRRRSGVKDRDPLHMADRCFPKEVPSGFLSVNSSFAASAVIDPQRFASAVADPPPFTSAIASAIGHAPPRRAPPAPPLEGDLSLNGGQAFHGGQTGASGQTGRSGQPGGHTGQTGASRSPVGHTGARNPTMHPGMGDGPSGAAFVGGLMADLERLLQVLPLEARNTTILNSYLKLEACLKLGTRLERLVQVGRLPMPLELCLCLFGLKKKSCSHPEVGSHQFASPGRFSAPRLAGLYHAASMPTWK